MTIAVAAPHRRAGVGRALLAALLAQARLDGLPALSLSVEADNPARHLYQRMGFVLVESSGSSQTIRAIILGAP
ncbi:hypothetical protein BH20ACT8_BH20ACT8_17300 [soil metagenome]